MNALRQNKSPIPAGPRPDAPLLHHLPAPKLADIVALRLTYRWCDGPARLPPSGRALARSPQQTHAGHAPKNVSTRSGPAASLNSWFREQLLHGLRNQACLHLQTPRPACVHCDFSVRKRCPLPAVYPPLGSGEGQPRQELASLHSIDVLAQGPELRLVAGDLVLVDLVLIGPALRGAGPLLSALRELEGGRLRLVGIDNLVLSLDRFEAPVDRWPLPVKRHPVRFADIPLLPVGDDATEAHLVDWLTTTGCLELELLTPMRLTRGSRDLNHFDLLVFTARLLGRLASLHETSAWLQHGDAPSIRLDDEAVRAEIEALAAAFTVDARTHVHQASRRGHGGHYHPAGGLRGVVRLTSAEPWALRRLSRALVVGAWIGVGRCATMGLGRLRARPAIALPPLTTPVPGSRGTAVPRLVSD